MNGSGGWKALRRSGRRQTTIAAERRPRMMATRRERGIARSCDTAPAPRTYSPFHTMRRPITSTGRERIAVIETSTGVAAGALPAAEQLLLDIIDTVREPLMVVDEEFRVTHANRAFYRTFQADAPTTIGEPLFAI